MNKTLHNRLQALEQRTRPGEHICLHYVDDGRFLVDGQDVEQEVFADLAPTARYVIEVRYVEDIWQPQPR